MRRSEFSSAREQFANLMQQAFKGRKDAAKSDAGIYVIPPRYLVTLLNAHMINKQSDLRVTQSIIQNMVTGNYGFSQRLITDWCEDMAGFIEAVFLVPDYKLPNNVVVDAQHRKDMEEAVRGFRRLAEECLERGAIWDEYTNGTPEKDDPTPDQIAERIRALRDENTRRGR